MSKLIRFKESTPNNWKFLENDNDIDEIVIGGSVTHTFELDFDYFEVVRSAEVVYKQGLEVKLAIPVKNEMVKVHKNRSIIYIYLPPVYTSNFDDTVLDTYCQLWITTKEGKKMPDIMHKLKVIRPIPSSDKVTPVSDIIVNGKSIVENGIASISGIVSDFSETRLFSLDDLEFNELVENHCFILDSSRLTIDPDLLQSSGDVIISAAFGNNVKNIKLAQNSHKNFMGEIVLTGYANIYEITISLLTNAAGTIAVLRSANIR